MYLAGRVRATIERLTNRMVDREPPFIAYARRLWRQPKDEEQVYVAWRNVIERSLIMARDRSV